MPRLSSVPQRRIFNMTQYGPKKTFQEDDMRVIGSDSSYKGEPGIIYSSEETTLLAAQLKFALIRLPSLPVHLFEKNALFTLASKIGKPLRMDEPTADLSRPDLARVCVELDVTPLKSKPFISKLKGKLIDNK
ncbi:hypothetical protein Sango_3044800 [Sesamum angolense]|uniref:RES domain-containing protein n=1 Tax=Sesamum angolense TaxID=2727404 RepID=A0AAE1W1D1_9LAMI|nr:hypothetical protein Sango_3044800 [Sesamum angolense]